MENIEKALKRIVSGEPPREVAREMGLPYGTMMKKLNAHPEYKERREKEKQAREAVLQGALQRVLAGESAREVARDTGYSHGGLLGALKDTFPAYNEYRQAQESSLKKVQAEVLERVLAGERPSKVAREMGLPKGTVDTWLHSSPAYQALRKAITTDEMVCPCCKGTLERQELFFWLCECGVEFWPDEETIPEDPGEWWLPPTARHYGLTPALNMIRDMREEGRMNTEIVDALNAAGYTTIQGKKWNPCSLHEYTRKFNIADNWSVERQRILAIVEPMAGRIGITCVEIADQLNRAGYKTSQNNPWTAEAVRLLIRETLKMDVRLKGTRNLAPRRVVTGAGSTPGEDHPWRLMNEASFQEHLARQREKVRGGEDH